MLPYPIVPFAEFVPSAPAVPKLYWDVKSQEQRWHRLCELAKKLACYCNELGIAINQDHTIITKLLEDFEAFRSHGYDEYYAQQVEAWIAANMQKIIDAMSQQLVFFGLTDDGYFTAYIPSRFAFVLDTVNDYSSEDYGRLTIRY